MNNIEQRIANELGVRTGQVEAAVRLLDEGATVPFIARYRKEVTEGLDDAQLRSLQDRLVYLRELEERRAAILKSIEEQSKLTPALAQQVKAAATKTELEDLYLPYKPKRRTKAQIAREAGLEPLADLLLQEPHRSPEAEAEAFLNPDQGVSDVKAALDGARQILMERFAEDPDLAGRLREYLWDNGLIESRVVPEKQAEGAKFSDYFEYVEALKSVPSHRALALFRGRREGVLRLTLSLPEGQEERPQAMIAVRFGVEDRGRAADAWLAETVRWGWRVKLYTRLDLDLTGRLREQAEEEAIRVFALNLRQLLLAAPAGPRATLGLDPGLRTGVKVTVVDATGKVVDVATIYPHAPKNRWDESIHTLAELAQRHSVQLVAIGNGTASRETDRLAADLMARHPRLGLTKVMVSEAGASVYSASEYASGELPTLDVSLRGAVSIARRLQDPLAELVKIDPKAIGVGQYQHDVSQTRLAHTLDGVVEDCVNSVGVDLNTASAPLLARVAGLSAGLARNLIEYRDGHGAFRSRRDLLKVPRLGPKAFEQCAGFLRIAGGDSPLDASAVHPEAYPVVERIVVTTGRPIQELIGDAGFLQRLRPEDYTDDRFGLPTVRDIFVELEKPGRDPRPEFRTATFREGVETLADLKPGMLLEGVVTNVTNFGAFVDVGVHQDGLVHISQLADRFVKDPHEVVKPGDIVKVKVLEVDLARRRIALTRRTDEVPGPAPRDRPAGGPRARSQPPQRGRSKPDPQAQAQAQAQAQGGAMADAFRRAGKG